MDCFPPVQVSVGACTTGLAARALFRVAARRSVGGALGSMLANSDGVDDRVVGRAVGQAAHIRRQAGVIGQRIAALEPRAPAANRSDLARSRPNCRRMTRFGTIFPVDVARYGIVVELDQLAILIQLNRVLMCCVDLAADDVDGVGDRNGAVNRFRGARRGCRRCRRSRGTCQRPGTNVTVWPSVNPGSKSHSIELFDVGSTVAIGIPSSVGRLAERDVVAGGGVFRGQRQLDVVLRGSAGRRTVVWRRWHNTPCPRSGGDGPPRPLLYAIGSPVV